MASPQNGTTAQNTSTISALPFSPAAITALQEWQAAMQRAMLQSVKTWEVLRKTDPEPVGQTPRDVIWQQGTARLYHYRAVTPSVHPVPLLLVTSLVSKAYILDLIPGNSFVEYLVGQGFDVYMIDWGVPRPEDTRLRLDDYILDMLPRVVDEVLETSEASELSILGYCLGGVMALLYTATHPEAPVRNLISLATPVDNANGGLQAFWAQEPFMDVDRLVDTLGNVPAEHMLRSFRMLKPASDASPVRYINLWQNVLNDQFVAQYRAFDAWATDQIPFPGEAFRQLTKELVRENKLFKGTLELRGIPARLSDIRCAFLAIAAEKDHLVPLAATTCQEELIGSTDKELVVMPGGHVGLVAGRKAVMTLWPKVAGWLAERSHVAAEPTDAVEAAEAQLRRDLELVA